MTVGGPTESDQIIPVTSFGFQSIYLIKIYEIHSIQSSKREWSELELTYQRPVLPLELVKHPLVGPV